MLGSTGKREVFMAFRLSLFSLTLLLTAALRAPAQDTTMVPRELALALIGTEFGVRPTLTVARPPSGFPQELVPASGRVLGGVSTQRGQRMLVIVAMPDPPDVALDKAEASLKRAGWRTPPMPEASMSGGFVSMGHEMGTALCKDASAVWTSVVARDNGGSLLRMSVSPTRYTQCDSAISGPMRMTEDELRLPTLRQPAGTRSFGGGTCGGGDSREATAQIESRLSPAELLTHYAAQLQEQGWTLGPRAGDSTIFVQTARRRDDKGRDLTSVLGVMATPVSRARTVWLHVNAARQEEP
jgi:hypothetical protein